MPVFFINQPKCVFSHIPKTGGHSIRNEFFKRDFEGPFFGDALPSEWEDVFKFAFVRNPFDRLVSAYIMFTQGTEDDSWNLPEGGTLELTLEQVLRIGLDPEQEFGHPRYNGIKQNPLTRLKNHIIPQTHAYHGLQHIDFVGRFEKLQADFSNVVAKKLGLENSVLPVTNTTRHSHYREYFNLTTRKLAEQLYREDLDTFGYKF